MFSVVGSVGSLLEAMATSDKGNRNFDSSTRKTSLADREKERERERHLLVFSATKKSGSACPAPFLWKKRRRGEEDSVANSQQAFSSVTSQIYGFFLFADKTQKAPYLSFLILEYAGWQHWKRREKKEGHSNGDMVPVCMRTLSVRLSKGKKKKS